MNNFINPGWIKAYAYSYPNINEIKDSVYLGINDKLDKLTSLNPEVTIIIAVWNEEANVLSTISSLSNSNTTIPLEFIIINNNSTDRTQELLNRLHVKTIMQPLQGCGPARQVGLEQAKGKYILSADADCIYPPDWITEMTNALKEPGVVCVYGRYSFIGNERNRRWKYFVYEKLKNVMAGIRSHNRPFLNSLGMSMGFIKEYALKVGYIMENVRGEDGMLTFSLMQFGEVRAVNSDNCRIWTGTRTIDKKKHLFIAIASRVWGGLMNLSVYLKKPVPYNEKTAQAYHDSLKNSKRKF